MYNLFEATSYKGKVEEGDAMETLFTVLLGVGVGYAIIGFLLGQIMGGGDSDISGIMPFNSYSITIFIIVFGGTGLMFMRSIPAWTAVSLSAFLGIAAAFIFYRFIYTPLYKAQNTTAIEIQSLIGHRAQVTEKIPQGKFGKITYKVNDSIYTAPAKAEDGNEILRNTSVEIVYIENNAYYVRPA